MLVGLIVDAALDRVGGRLFDAAFSALGRFTGNFFKRLRRVCCFVEGTLVLTPEGPVPIETIEVGDLVVTRDQYRPAGPLVTQPVTQVFKRVARLVLWLTLASGETLGVGRRNR